MTTNIITGKKYIGCCSRDDDNYVGSGTLLKEAIKKYGRESFTRVILQECSSLDELATAEKEWIAKYNAVESDEYYNLSDGGFGGNSVATKLYWDSLTKEERSARNAHRRGWDVKGENNPMYGKSTSHFVKEAWAKRTAEERSEICKKSAQTRKERGIGVGSAAYQSKPVKVKYNNIEYNFASIKEASVALDIPYRALSSTIKRKSNHSPKYNLTIYYANT